MVQKVESAAQEFEFEEVELAAACKLDFLHECFLRNELYKLQSARSKLPANPEVPLKHILEFEFMRGQIATLEYLLELHDQVKDTI